MVPYGIDEEKLLIQIERLKEHLKKILELKEKVKDEIIKEVIERNLHLAIEDCIIIGNQIISGLGLKRPETYREIFEILKKEKIISKRVSEEMGDFVSIRNRLVHLYWDVSEEEIKEVINKINFFDEFVKEVLKFLKRREK